MRQPLPFRRVLALLAGAALVNASAACNDDGGDGPTSGIVPAVKLSRDVAAPGDTVSVLVTLSNPTREITGVSGSGSCLVRVVIRDMSGTKVGAVGETCSGEDSQQILIAPGDTAQRLLQIQAPTIFGQYQVLGGIGGAQTNAPLSAPDTLTVASGAR